MPATMPLVITVARQLGSGGSYIGRRVAQRLGYAYIDRQILQQAAIELGVEEAVLEDRDERLQGFWERLLTVFALGPPDGTYTPPPHLVTDADLIETERHLIPQLATRGPCVLLGHGGFHLLRDSARLFNVFVYAPMEFRVARVMSIYHAKSEDEAVRTIERSDHERRRYIQSFVGVDWFDARNYHLSIDTGMVDFSKAEQLIISLATQLPEEKNWPWVSQPI